MTEYVELVAFLRARIAEDEQRFAKIHVLKAPFDPRRLIWADSRLTDIKIGMRAAVIDLIFGYEEFQDGENGCNHHAQQIELGECSQGISPYAIEVLKKLSALYLFHPNYRAEWKPPGVNEGIVQWQPRFTT